MKAKQTKINKVTPLVLHGEAMIFKSKLPKNAKRISPSNDTFHIIAPSETTGNHHVVDCFNSGVEFYMDEDGTMYMINEKETNVRCVQENRHGTIPLEPGCWEFGTQQEYNYLDKHLQKVRD